MSDSNIQKLREISGHLIDPEIAIRIFEEIPDAILMVDSTGIIQLVNRQAELLFGYPRKELFDQSITMLVPTSLKEQHNQHILNYFADPRVRPMGIGLKLDAIRKDLSQFPAEINLSPIITSGGVFALAVIRKVRDSDGARS